MHSIAETAVIWKWTMTTIMTGHAAVRIKAAGFHRAQKPVPPFSGKKLIVTTRVLAKITNSFIGRKEEAGGILGANKSLDIVDSFALIPAEKAGKYYYIPDIEAANRQIHQWAKEEICFCGFIHSHITDKKESSEGDIKFAEQLFNSFHLPVLWFGLQILTKKCRETKFYSVQKSDTKVEISSVCWEMEGEDDIECFADDSVHNLCGSFVYLL